MQILYSTHEHLFNLPFAHYYITSCKFYIVHMITYSIYLFAHYYITSCKFYIVHMITFTFCTLLHHNVMQILYSTHDHLFNFLFAHYYITMSCKFYIVYMITYSIYLFAHYYITSCKFYIVHMITYSIYLFAHYYITTSCKFYSAIICNYFCITLFVPLLITMYTAMRSIIVTHKHNGLGYNYESTFDLFP